MKRHLTSSLCFAALTLALSSCGSLGNPAQPEYPTFTSPAAADVARPVKGQTSLSDSQFKAIGARLTREEGRPVTFSPTLIRVKLPPAEKQLLDKVCIHPLPAGLTGRKVMLTSLQPDFAGRITDHMGLIYDHFIGEPYPGVLTKDEALKHMVILQIFAGQQPVAYLVRTGFLDPQIAPDPDMYEAAYTAAGRLLKAREVVEH